MFYGRKRRFGYARTSRWGSRSRFGYRRRFKTQRFALKKRIEKKYHDKSLEGRSVELPVGASGNDNRSKGYMYTSSQWWDYNFANDAGVAKQVNADWGKGLPTGATARTRIGNKITPKYYKGAFTFTAACVEGGIGDTQHGETVVSSEEKYLRTTYRMCIVKDLQANSQALQVNWNDVFENGTNMTGGIHAELNVNNMGRFIILDDKTFTLNARNPQKTCPFLVPGKKMGGVRYNGSSGEALTDKGISCVFAAFVMGIEGIVSTDITLPPVVGNTRMCFSDE